MMTYERKKEIRLKMWTLARGVLSNAADTRAAMPFLVDEEYQYAREFLLGIAKPTRPGAYRDDLDDDDVNESFDRAPARILRDSFAGIHCNQDGCFDSLTLSRRTAGAPTNEDDYQALLPARDEAAASLGWRVYRNLFLCPLHVVARKLVCARCLLRCPACACMGGPRLDAVSGMEEG